MERIASVVQALAEPIAEDLGVEVLAVQIAGGRTPVVRIVLHRPGGVDCDLLERFSRAISLQLDAADPIRGAYRLEISSPGFDWPMTTAADFARWAGERVRVVDEDGRTWVGRNLGPDGEDAFRLEQDGGDVVRMALARIVRAVREPDWGDRMRGGAQKGAPKRSSKRVKR